MRFSFLIVFFFLNLNAIGQNLVPNPSFEDYSICPDGSNLVVRCNNWSSFGMSPDYWGSCSPFPGESLPNISFGYQSPHSGGCLVGLATWWKNSIPPGPNYREFVGAQLLSPLVIGQKYFLSFYCNNTYNQGAACNKMGLKFSTVSFDSCCPPPLTNSAHLYTDSITMDTLNWTYISGSFIADSAYSFIMLGNFFDDAYTDTLALRPFPYNQGAYYYFDDLCVSTDSNYCQTWTSVDEIFKETSVFPNPSNEFVSIHSNSIIESYILIDSYGRQIIRCLINESSFTLSMTNFKEGIYFLKLYSLHKTSTIKLIHSP